MIDPARRSLEKAVRVRMSRIRMSLPEEEEELRIDSASRCGEKSEYRFDLTGTAPPVVAPLGLRVNGTVGILKVEADCSGEGFEGACCRCCMT